MSLSRKQIAYMARKAAIGELTGEIAHYQRNNLAVTYGNLQLLAERDQDFLDDKYEQITNDALTAAEKNAVLTRVLSDLSIEGVEGEVIDANQVLLSFANIAQIALGKDIQIESYLAETALPIAVDWGELTACLLFLVLNARAAMPSDGVFSINSGVSDDETSAVIRISDSGCGMTPDVLARATELYFTTGDTEKSSGLGLAVAKGFAESVEGELRIISAVDEGTTVSIHLPLVS